MDEQRSHHLIIAGTGRSGTTFLVRYLTEFGMDTHLTRHGAAQFDAQSQAGFEDMPLIDDDLPYIVKAPWIGEYIDAILTSDKLAIDAAILPMRDLAETAASRCIIEMHALHQNAPWMAQRLGTTFENWASTPGGALYSLNPIDQGRILAVGFHRLVHRLVEANVPIVFVAFPRIIEDADYLFERLRELLPVGTTAEQAREAHSRTAEREKVRVGDELKSAAPSMAQVSYPATEQLDRAALAREIARLTAERARLRAEVDRLTAALEVEATKQPSDQNFGHGDHVVTPIRPTPQQVALAARAFCEHQGLNPEELVEVKGCISPQQRWIAINSAMRDALMAAHVTVLGRPRH
jgi:hypothetical protein